MNNMSWFTDITSITDQIKTLAEMIKETVDKFDAATAKLIDGAVFEKDDECDGALAVDVPIHTENEMTVTLSESAIKWQDIDCIEMYNDNLVSMWVPFIYRISFKDSPKLGDHVDMLEIVVDLGMRDCTNYIDIDYSFAPTSYHANKYARQMHPNAQPGDLAYSSFYDDGDVMNMFKHMLSERTAAMFIEWLDAIITAVSEFNGSFEAVKERLSKEGGSNGNS